MQDAIVEAKNRFLHNLPIPDGAVRAEILASWRRSRDFGVQPGKVDKTVLPVADLQARIAAGLPFYDMAVPLMESLHEFTTGSGFLTTLSDEEGYVLRLLGDPDITALAAKNALVEGCNRSERRIGTNAIGTPLETGRPIQVFGSEHFYDPHVVWVCSGAPIFDARGAITGSICIIGTYDKVSFHTLGMAAAAEAITRQLKMKAAYDTIDAIRSRMDVMQENMQNGVLLLDKHMVVQQANNLAGTMLGRTREELNGVGFRELFGDVVQPGGVADFHDRPVTVSHRGRERNLSLSLMTTDDGEFVAILERVETLHKRANKVMGSEARFTFADVIGESVELKTAIGMAQTAARTNANILLLGESGTGKELFAQSIHNASDRRSGPFVAINCGALPKSLIQSELFGYEGGSFTGASRDGAAGKFELANGGTIFLDEIGDMPFDVQVTLLRVLQTREVVRIGGKKSIRIDVRIIAATNRDLEKSIANNEFREDLYYRLNVFAIPIPPLRERQGDVRILSEYMLCKAAGTFHKRLNGFTAEALAAMERYDWPGNLRELENAVERAVLLAQGDVVGLAELPRSMSATRTSERLRPRAPLAGVVPVAESEERLIREAVAAFNGNIRQSSRHLGLSRSTLYRKMKKYHIDGDSPRQ